jgi:hypothetical protein
MSAAELPIEVPAAPRRKHDDPSITEGEMTQLLERHYTKTGNGGSGEYAFLAQVRNAAGFDAKRTFDAVAIGLWPSRGHDIHVIEIKVSRSDWLRELAKPDKAEDASKVADRFSVAAPRGVVDIGEVPATWGYIEVSGGVEEFTEEPSGIEGIDPFRIRTVTGRKVRTVRAAPLLRSPEECRGPIPRAFLVPLLRAAGAVPTPQVTPEALLKRHADEAVRAARSQWQEEVAAGQSAERAELAQLREFKRLAGPFWWHDEETMRAKARDIRAAMQSRTSPGQILESLRRMQDEISRAVRGLERKIDAAGETREPT